MRMRRPLLKGIYPARRLCRDLLALGEGKILLALLAAGAAVTGVLVIGRRALRFQHPRGRENRRPV